MDGAIPALTIYPASLRPFSRQAPGPHRAVGATADQPSAIGAEGEAVHRCRVARERERAACRV
ncbi:hypothetical protein D9M68_613450 [compost metagenome]